MTSILLGTLFIRDVNSSCRFWFLDLSPLPALFGLVLYDLFLILDIR